MFSSIAKSVVLRRATKVLPIAKVLVIAQVALLARRHVQLLQPAERRRFVNLVRRGRSLSEQEKQELRVLTARLEPRAFAWSAVDQLSPVPLPKRLTKPPPR